MNLFLGVHTPLGSYTLPIGDASKPEIRLTAQTPEDVANVVLRRNALGKSALPPVHDAADDGDARIVYVLDGDAEAILIGQGEVLPV